MDFIVEILYKKPNLKKERFSGRLTDNRSMHKKFSHAVRLD